MAEPLDFTATQKAAKNGGREALNYELQDSNSQEDEGWQGALSQLRGQIVEEVSKAASAGGDNGQFQQAINTSYSGTLVVLYEARLIPGPISHPLTGKTLPRQKTTFDDILDAIGKGGGDVEPTES